MSNVSGSLHPWLTDEGAKVVLGRLWFDPDVEMEHLLADPKLLIEREPLTALVRIARGGARRNRGALRIPGLAVARQDQSAQPVRFSAFAPAAITTSTMAASVPAAVAATARTGAATRSTAVIAASAALVAATAAIALAVVAAPAGLIAG
jgi:hypothetical protein